MVSHCGKQSHEPPLNCLNVIIDDCFGGAMEVLRTRTVEALYTDVRGVPV